MTNLKWWVVVGGFTISCLVASTLFTGWILACLSLTILNAGAHPPLPHSVSWASYRLEYIKLETPLFRCQTCISWCVDTQSTAGSVHSVLEVVENVPPNNCAIKLVPRLRHPFTLSYLSLVLRLQVWSTS